MNLNVEDIRKEMQLHVGHLNQLNQRVNETIGAINALQGLIAKAEYPSFSSQTELRQEIVNPISVQEDVPQ